MLEPIFFNPYVWIGFALIAIFVGIGVFFFISARRYVKTNKWDDSKWFRYLVSCAAFMASLAISITHFFIVLVPYDASFYQTYRMTGEVTEIEAAFSGDEGTMSQVFVAKIEGIQEFVKSDDQRFRTVEAGDAVNLVCSKIFNYFQEPYYDCNFAS